MNLLEMTHFSPTFSWSSGRELGRIALLTLSFGLGAVEVAQAQNEPQGEEAAQLFESAMSLLEAGRHSEACPKLEASQTLDPQVGTLLYLAYCLESQGLTAEAHAKYREAEELALTRNDERHVTARERAAALEPQLKEAAVEDPPPNAAEQPQRTTTSGVSLDSSEDEPGRIFGVPQRTLALVAGGVGVVGFGLGTVFGLQARATWNDAKQRCPGLECTREEDQKLGDDASSSATLATIAFAAGSVALAGGVVLWLTAPEDSSTASSHTVGSRSMTPTGYRVMVAGETGGLSLSFGGGF